MCNTLKHLLRRTFVPLVMLCSNKEAIDKMFCFPFIGAGLKFEFKFNFYLIGSFNFLQIKMFQNPFKRKDQPQYHPPSACRYR